MGNGLSVARGVVQFRFFTISFATDKPFSSQQSEVANGSFCHCLRFYGSEYCVRVSGQKVLGIPCMIDLGYGCRYVDYSVKEEKNIFFYVYIIVTTAATTSTTATSTARSSAILNSKSTHKLPV